MLAVNNQVPVTALRFINTNALLAGAGAFLKLYDWTKNEILACERLFPVDNIHGIFSFASHALVWGGTSIAIVHIEDSKLKTAKTFRFKDRIIDAQVFDDRLFVLTAHNEVLEFNAINYELMATHKCTEASVLYSGSLYLSRERQLVAAGTVFGGVVIWDLKDNQITHNFEVHEGSIFDVEWSADARFVASCSDDRAIYISNLKANVTVAEGWGHISRIWKLKFAANNTLVSVAEDCSARVWKISNESRELTCERILTGHQGKSIWSLDILHGIAATGGGDGKIMLWDLSTLDEFEEEKWDITTEFGGPIRSCNIAQDGTCAVSTSAGYLYFRIADIWKKATDESIGAVPIVKAHGNMFVAVTANGQGLMINSDTSGAVRFNANIRVLDFYVLDADTLIIVPTPPAVNPILLNIKTGDQQEILMSSKIGTSTCAVRCGAHKFCIGSRKGDLLVYEDMNSQPIAHHSRALGTKSDAVTDLSFIDDEIPYIVASSRSSEYGYFAVPSLKRLYKTRTRKRGSIEGLYHSHQGLVLWGFQKDYFVAWNVTLGCDFLSLDCGGSHRSWALCVLPHKLMFVYVRASELVSHTVHIPSTAFASPQLQEGTHGREIRGMEACPTNPKLIATGSEDTLIKIGWLNDNYTLHNECLIRDGHVSGIQCLHWSPCGKYLFTGAGQGELVIWEVITSGQVVFASEVGRMPSIRGSDIHELRVMDFNILEDTVAVAFSDSSFRLWKLSGLQDKTSHIAWELQMERKYRECCLLNIDLVKHELQNYVLITSTDGHLVVYADTQEILREPLHQSGVRCSCIARDGDTYWHFSGGDDNSVCAVKLTFNQPQIQRIFRVPAAHASAVTSIKYVPQVQKVVSIGSDQKVRVWTAAGHLLESVYTSVSDTGPLIVQEKLLATAGIGIEVFHHSIQ